MTRPAIACLTLLSCLAASAAWSADPETGAGQAAPAVPGADSGLEVEEIVISATAEQAAGPSVKKVEREEIERRGAQTLSDILAEQPALQSETGSRGERTLVLRGFDQRQILLLVDSVPFFIPYDGQVDINMIPAEMIDHLTVVKGPGSVLFGPSGLGGAINVVTRRPGTGPLLQAAAEVDREGDTDLRAVSSIQAGPVGTLLGGTFLRSPGFPLSASFQPTFIENGGLRQNSDRSYANAFANLRWDITPDQHLTLGGFYLSAVKGVPPSTISSQARFWRFNDWSAAGASIGHEARFDFGLETDEVFFARFFDNLFDLYTDSTYTHLDLTNPSFHNWYHDRLLGGRIRGRYPLVHGDWGDVLLRLWSEVQGDSHQEDPIGGGGKHVTRTLLTLAPEAAALFVQGFTLTASLQAEFEFPGEMPSPAAGTKAEFNPLVSVGYTPLPGLSLLASVAHRTRFPTLKERFSSFLGQNQPNPGLLPEGAWHFGLDASWEPIPSLLVQAAFYDAEASDLIESMAVGGGVNQLQNTGKSRLIGAELSVGYSPWTWLTASAGYAYLYPPSTNLPPPNDRLGGRPEHKLTLQVTIEPLPHLEFSTVFQLVGPTAFQNPASMLWGTLGLYELWDARLAYRFDRWTSVWLRATNLLDLDYQIQYGFPESGFNLAVGFRTSL